MSSQRIKTTEIFDRNMSATTRFVFNQGGTRCLVGDTLVLTEQGYKQIKNISIGDNVYSVLGDICELKPVVNKFVYKAVQHNTKTLIFVFENNQIQCTYEHRFRVKGEWIKAIDLARRRVENSERQICDLDTWKDCDILQTHAHNEVPQDRDNETVIHRNGLLSNGDECKIGTGAQSYCKNVYPKSREQKRSKPQRREYAEQSCNEFGVGNAQGEHRSCGNQSFDSGKPRREKRDVEVNKRSGIGNKEGLYSLCGYDERFSKEIRSYQSNGKRCVEWQDLEEGSIIDIIFTDIDSPVYDIEVQDYHSFLVTKNNIVSHNSSKTYSLMQLAYHIAKEEQNKIISIVSETMPHLKKGAMRDFFNYLEQYGFYDPKAHNKTDNIYRVGTSIIEFFSADSSDKVHGPGRDYLFVNEIQNLTYETFFHLAQRTNIRIYADYNPTHNFWVYPNFINEPEYKSDLTYIHSTIFDNPFVSEAIKKDVLIRASKDSNYRKVYLEGEPGTLEGLVFETFNIIGGLPEGLNYVYGLDFGYSNDPTALVRIAIKGDNIFLDECIYRTGLTNSDIIALFKDHDIKPAYDELIADSAEPKSIEDIKRAGYNVKPAVKGSDSITNGISLIKQYNIHVTQRSTNIIKEFRNYAWVMDKNGNATNKPSDIFNHAMDALRYGVQALAKPVLADYFL